MSQLPLPIIDWQRCTGCGFCIELCPPQALAQDLELYGGKAYLRDPDACTYCSACEEVCPEDAIALPFLILLAPDQSPTPKPSTDDSARPQ